jgi:iron complex transport system permease protein
MSLSIKFTILGLCLVCAIGLSMTSGVADISVADLLATFAALFGGPAEPDIHIKTIIIWDVRLPRILLGGLTGACLATTGAAIQGLFRNPLADPALIGVSSGAALVAAFSIVFGGLFGGLFGEISGFWLFVPFVAFLGGLLATWLVMWLGTSVNGTSVSLMLLAGIAINAVAIAGVGTISYLSNESQLRSVTFWALGSFSDADWRGVGLSSAVLAVVLLLCRESGNLNAIILGESEARYLGVEVEYLKKKIVVLTALGTGVAVSLAGIVAFIGLVVPHLIRLSMSADHRVLLPASALLGAILVICADALSRVVVAPAELPVGIVTSLIGGPFFIYLIIRQKQKTELD